MFLTDKIIKSISDNEFSIDFVDIVLKQAKQENPSVYKGCGNVFFNKKGSLCLKALCAYTDEQSSSSEFVKTFDEMKDVPVGKLIPLSHFYTLEATDFSGRKWRTENIDIKTDSKEKGVVITANIAEGIECRELCKNYGDIHFYFVHYGKINLPWNEWVKKENGGSLSAFRFENEYISFYAKHFNNEYVIFDIDFKGVYKRYSMSRLLIEALRIITGKFVFPVISIKNFENKREIKISPKPVNFESKKLLSLVKCFYYKDEDFISFLGCYLNYQNEPESSLYRYWFRIFYSSDSYFENKNLVLTVSIEGLLRENFEKYGKEDSEKLKNINDLISILKNLEINDEIKARVINIVAGMRNFSAVRTLRVFEDDGIITKKW